SVDALRGNHPPATRALVFDDRGDIEAASVAETLLDRGIAVTYATSAQVLAPHAEWTYQQERYVTHLSADERFDLRTRQAVLSVTPTHVTLSPLEGGRVDDVPADLVVWVGRALPRNELANELRDHGATIKVVGDAVGTARLLGLADLPQAILSGYAAVAG